MVVCEAAQLPRAAPVKTPGLDASQQLLYEDNEIGDGPLVSAGDDIYGNEEAVKGLCQPRGASA